MVAADIDFTADGHIVVQMNTAAVSHCGIIGNCAAAHGEFGTVAGIYTAA